MDYDADTAPEAGAWLAAPEAERTAAVLAHHEGRFPDALHKEGANPILHASLHQIVETQAATDHGAARAVARLTGEGLRRHAAIHAVMQIFAEELGSLGADGGRFDAARYEARLDRLSAADALGQALRTAQFATEPPAQPGPNRAERRAAKRKDKS